MQTIDKSRVGRENLDLQAYVFIYLFTSQINIWQRLLMNKYLEIITVNRPHNLSFIQIPQLNSPSTKDKTNLIANLVILTGWADFFLKCVNRELSEVHFASAMYLERYILAHCLGRKYIVLRHIQGEGHRQKYIIQQCRRADQNEDTWSEYMC
jgi:hypothetical protein